MRGVGAAAGLMLVTAFLATASASGGNQPVVECFNQAHGTKPVFRTRPERCHFVKRDKPPAYAFSVFTKDLHWKKWGDRRAKASGKALGNMTNPALVIVRLSRPRRSCGRLVFSHATFEYPTVSSNRVSLKLDTCR